MERNISLGVAFKAHRILSDMGIHPLLPLDDMLDRSPDSVVFPIRFNSLEMNRACLPEIKPDCAMTFLWFQEDRITIETAVDRSILYENLEEQKAFQKFLIWTERKMFGISSSASEMTSELALMYREHPALYYFHNGVCLNSDFELPASDFLETNLPNYIRVHCQKVNQIMNKWSEFRKSHMSEPDQLSGYEPVSMADLFWSSNLLQKSLKQVLKKLRLSTEEKDGCFHISLKNSSAILEKPEYVDISVQDNLIRFCTAIPENSSQDFPSEITDSKPPLLMLKNCFNPEHHYSSITGMMEYLFPLIDHSGYQKMIVLEFFITNEAQAEKVIQQGLMSFCWYWSKVFEKEEKASKISKVLEKPGKYLSRKHILLNAPDWLLDPSNKKK